MKVDKSMRYTLELLIAIGIIGLMNGCVSSSSEDITPKSVTVVNNSTNSSLPFTGRRVFNFMGTDSTAEDITINNDGTTVVGKIPYGDIKRIVYYKGEYQNPIPIDDETKYYINGNRIFILNSDGSIANGCPKVSGTTEEKSPICVSELKE